MWTRDFSESRISSRGGATARHEIEEALRQAYVIRSRYAHDLRPRPDALELAGNTRDVTEVDRRPVLTFQGLVRLTHHVITAFVAAGTRNNTKHPEEEWQEIAAPVIIPEAEWLEVQAGIARNASHITPARIVSGPTMLAGIAKCGYPGYGHALSIATGKGGRYRYYRCSRRLRRDETACAGTSMRDEKLEAVVIDAMAERLLQRARLRELPANLLDDSSAAVRQRQAHLKALRTERTRVEGAIQNMFDFIEQGVVSARDADFTARLAAQRTRRADLEQEILLTERQLSAADRRVTPEASSDWAR